MNNYRRKDLKGRQHFNEDFGAWFITAGTEDDYDKIDLYMTAKTRPDKTYAVEIKDYTNSGFDRPYSKFVKDGIDYGYQIDFDKVDNLIKEAEKNGRIPLIYARFTDITLVWNLSYGKIRYNYENRKKLVNTNVDGQNYGARREPSWQTYLYRDEACYDKETIRR